MNKVVIALDSFKGSLSSSEAGKAAEEGIRKIYPQCEIIQFPISDGGEGILEILMTTFKGKYIHLTASNPLMQPVKTKYGISEDGKTAFIEMAAISGLLLVPSEKRNPLITTSYGTGELIVDALDRGFRNFIIGIGGSATNDAGLGMLQALGFRFYNSAGKLLGAGGKMMKEVARIDNSTIHPALQESQFTIASDVDNLFCGPTGAAFVFCVQKGADEEMIRQLDEGMYSLAKIIEDYTGKDILHVPGAGAAGGIGGAFFAFLNANLTPGIDLLLEKLNFHTKITNADYIITGEGKADKQTLMGKVPSGILREAQKQQIPVLLIAGKVEDEIWLKKAGFKDVLSINPAGLSLEQAMNPTIARKNITQTIERFYTS